jgi:hypothetical protein
MAVRNSYLDFALMKIILQNWAWNNLAFITGYANITFFKEVPNLINDIATIQQQVMY